MELASIGAASHVEVIEDRLRHELGFLGDRLRLNTARRGHLEFVSVGVSERALTPGLTLETYLSHVASAVAASILDAFEPALLEKTLRRHYGGFAEPERATILAQAKEHLGQTTVGLLGSAGSRKQKLAYTLLEHLRGRAEVVVEGFLAFRLRDYAGVLEEAVDQAVDDFLLEREYSEFIRLLRYFVAVQEPRIPLCHLVLRGAKFHLLDREGRPLDVTDGDCIAHTLEAEMSYDDLVLSALIAAAPRRIRLHGRGEDGAVDLRAVRCVFEGRVEVCRRHPCLLCHRAPFHLDRQERRRYTRA